MGGDDERVAVQAHRAQIVVTGRVNLADAFVGDEALVEEEGGLRGEGISSGGKSVWSWSLPAVTPA